MPRVVSFIVLLAISLLIGSLFFKVMMQFVLPLFIAALLVVLFTPVHERLRGQWPRWPRVVAVATTAIILLSVVAPLTWLGWNAYRETVRVVNLVEDHRDELQLQLYERLATEPEPPAAEEADPEEAPEAEPADDRPADGEEAQEEQPPSPEPMAGLFQRFTDWYQAQFDKEFETEEYLDMSISWLSQNATALVVGSVQTMFSLTLGIVITVVSLYYFLADGPAMIRALTSLSPLDESYEKQLLDRFSDVSRAVVMATVLSAIAQGLVAGVAYFFVLPSGWPVFLLTALTMVFAVVPFVGSAAVWVPLCICVALFGASGISDGGELVIEGNTTSAIGLALYSAFVVGNTDNIVKPMVLHGQSNLHPLLALLSVIGGVQAMGPIGILIGPMIVSFLQALLAMLNQELHLFNNASDDNTKENRAEESLPPPAAANPEKQKEQQPPAEADDTGDSEPGAAPKKA